MSRLPFRILSLSGGGVRGIFQAVFLAKLQRQLSTPLHQQFDLIAGTSTGSIIALAIAIGVDLERVVDLYRNHSEKIFDPKFLYPVRKGPRYNQNNLKKCLNGIFGTKQLRDVKTKTLVTASCIDHFSHKVFSSFDTKNAADLELPLVEVALSSAAAPTYFLPVQPTSHERSYVDGGLWANSPSLIAVLYATTYLNVANDNIQVVSIGNGDFAVGTFSDFFQNTRLFSRKMISTIMELIFSSQESAAEELARELVGESNFQRISTPLQRVIRLDDAEAAVKTLPPLAEKEYEARGANVLKMLTQPLNPFSGPKKVSMIGTPELIKSDLIREVGLSAFYPSRKYYYYRENASSIDSYVNVAKISLVMVSINLMTGVHFDKLTSVLEEKLSNPEFKIVISLLNPEYSNLIFAVSPALSRTKEQLSESITDTLILLLKFRENLATGLKERFQIRVHNSLPFGSAILIDHAEVGGRIQIETKPYRAALNDSFAFEIIPSGNSGFYHTLVKGYHTLIEDGYSVEYRDGAMLINEKG